MGLTTPKRAVLRFNYRGVDGSTLHPTARREDETTAAYWQRVEVEKAYGPIVEDAAAALAWVRRAVPSAHCFHLVGYSFGAIIACLLAQWSKNEAVEGVESVAVIAPPLRRYPQPFTDSIRPRRAYFLAEKDFLYGPTEIADLAEKDRIGERFTLAGADHFFRSHEEELTCRVAEFLHRIEEETEA
jgi:alpha/beta superfamily hydrolase